MLKKTPTFGPGTKRVLAASLVGTSVEFYDFYIYATAASLVFGPMFFPSKDLAVQQLSSLATLAVAFIARPLGAAVFGHFGDRIGRKSTLVASLMLMGGSTVAIAFLPGYAQVGWLAPILLCVLRFGQGFGLGGEWGGAALLAVENAPPGWRSRFGMFPQLGAPVGFVFANGLFLLLSLLLSPDQFKAWGWRLPFVASSLLVAVGLWVRLKLHETPAFAQAMAEAPPSQVPLAEVFKRYPLRLLGGMFSVLACFALFYLTTTFALTYGSTTLGYGRSAFLAVQIGAILFMAVGIAFAGWWSDRQSPRIVLMAGSVLAVVCGFLIAPMMQAGSLALVFAFLALSLFVMGLVYGPLGAFLPHLFPARVRYTGASAAFNVGGVIGGGFTPAIALALAKAGGGLQAVGWCLSAAALASLLALIPLNREEP
ncbi:MAG TPA: MFS transporter [Caulobacteraceae bacterium]|jgi:metabolite-proton symporter